MRLPRPLPRRTGQRNFSFATIYAAQSVGPFFSIKRVIRHATRRFPIPSPQQRRNTHDKQVKRPQIKRLPGMAVFVVPSVGICQIRAFYDDCTAKRYSAREPGRNHDVNATEQYCRPTVYQTENKPDNILRGLPYPQQYFNKPFHFLFVVQTAIGNSSRTEKHGHCFIHSFFEIFPSPSLSGDASRWPITSLIVGYSSNNR